MAGKFTQGKWDLHIGGYCHSLIGGNGMKAHIVWGENYPHEGKANANLFLNAREVLEALERCVSIMENGVKFCPKCGKSCVFVETNQEQDQ